MRQKSSVPNTAAEQTIRDIRRRTRKQYSAEEKIRIVLMDCRVGLTWHCDGNEVEGECGLPADF